MSIISQETWDNMPDNEKSEFIRLYSEKLSNAKEAYKRGYIDLYHKIEDEAKDLENYFGKENLQPKPKIKTWEDILKAYPGTYGNENIELFPYNEFAWDVKLIRKNIATLKISKLIELGYGGMVSEEEWRDENAEKWGVLYNHNFGDFDIVKMTKGYGWKSFISFHTKQQADEFMSYPENKELIKQYHLCQ